jgi:hypothetical protein
MKKIHESFSEAGQESYVINVLKSKKSGHYVEIGAFHSTKASNTFILESKYSWSGVALEIESDRTNEYNLNRVNICVNYDARKFNYKKFYLENGFPSKIDYLQVDIEPAINSLLALIKATSIGYRYSIITFEHDGFINVQNKFVKNFVKIYLKLRGYILNVENVSNPGAPNNFYEDWYLCKSEFSTSSIKYYKNICSSELFS